MFKQLLLMTVLGITAHTSLLGMAHNEATQLSATGLAYALTDANTKASAENKPRQRQCETCHEMLPDLGALLMHRKRQHMNNAYEDVTTQPSTLRKRKPARGATAQPSTQQNSGADLNQSEEDNKKRPQKKIKPNAASAPAAANSESDDDTPLAQLVKNKKSKAESSKAKASNSGSDESEGIEEENTTENSSSKSFPCTFDGCARSFKQKQSMNRHLKTHSADPELAKPYTCEWPECTYRGSQKSHLKSHMYTHTGERPFQCTKCKKTFAQQATLDTHFATH